MQIERAKENRERERDLQKMDQNKYDNVNLLCVLFLSTGFFVGCKDGNIY